MNPDSYRIVVVKTCPKCGSRHINRRARTNAWECRPIGYKCKECQNIFSTPVFKEVKRSNISIPFYLKNKGSKSYKT